jgi:tRNA G10  N-methylase Trm11
LKEGIDIIVSDPPYGMQEKIRYNRAENEQEQVNEQEFFRESSIETLISLADEYLVTRGRLVFFIPVKHPFFFFSDSNKKPSTSVSVKQSKKLNLKNAIRKKEKKELINTEFKLPIPLPKSLRHVATFRQLLSPTFSRYLCVVEKTTLCGRIEMI